MSDSVTIERLDRGYIVRDWMTYSGERRRAYDSVEEAIEAVVLSLGDGSLHGYPAGTRVRVAIERPGGASDE